MKRYLLSLVLALLTINNLFAQRDTEHWIAPYYDIVGGYTNAVYLSTDSTTPVPVSIYNNDNLITTITISKGNPKTYTITNNLISANTSAEAFQVINKGLYLKAEKPFYCSLRLAQNVHGEIITSKGKAGIGKEFYVASSPNTSTNGLYNFTAGILATEDNTTVTVTWDNAAVTFIGGTPTGTSQTFTLNKGKSFILSGSGNNPANLSGFIGAKVVADKPIALTNGSCNGNFGIGSYGGSDPVLDQSVPIERLGNTFAMVKTRSTAPAQNMEGGIIIATQDNTEIFINGSTSPVATINAGKWYRIDESNYITQTGTGSHSNMYISTSKNVYLYQFVAVGSSNATCGFNYIPPLNCFLPRKIDEIGKINEMPNIDIDEITLKLNILTETGASVLVNGIAPTAAEGPYPLTGNTEWETYAIEGISGNVSITSTKAVTAGINGGYSSAGYGGYFAGFSSIPVIAKQSGDCAPGIILELDAGYETYQWYLNGTAINGATNNTYSPTQSGNYTVRVTMGTCPPVTTPIYKVQSCLKETSKSIEACSTKIIQPTFTSSTQTPAANTVVIVTQPTHGTATVNANGTITYVPQPGYIGNDIVVYKFCGNASEFIDCEQVTLTITMVPFVARDITIYACQYDNDPYAIFDLTTANVTDYNPVIKKYYTTLADLNAGTNPISDPTKYQSAGGIVYVKITTEDGCNTSAKITLITKPIKKSPLLVDKYICADATTTLDAGTEYNSYQWSTGATTSSIQNVSLGEYTVILEKNGCFLTQTVKVKKAADPIIKEIEITNNTATVIVEGGVPPYQYSVDDTTQWQDSNVFTNLSRGQHVFYVRDSYNCSPTSVEVTVPNLVNAITPNGDNKNDYIDYSELAYKENLSFVIYNRYGNKIFTGDKFNNYKWDGRHFGKKIVTGTYWYHITWNEPNKEKTPIKYTGWILVKNRE
ncbi:gliding motility-associated C-terminal domain-containing protein [Chryseobacterium nematophagum]|uniref:Gliding motility-associated C-terminal domain-containing protein n=1 Tax=Chryseobacterium nematophagum TaxID=2305228 RepID=A0A3M7L881_9FLAO|nr:gliding motility-associated C-terminal domain-containing protein [Chryseobacterium nematophagum]RMZ58160.1 gliding motility-associated C-terminal domain-containing protein [Chryseobacterium nematophagum]